MYGTVLHDCFFETYRKSFDTTKLKIKELGFSAVRDDLNKKYLPGKSIKSLKDYYKAKGIIDALVF